MPRQSRNRGDRHTPATPVATSVASPMAPAAGAAAATPPPRVTGVAEVPGVLERFLHPYQLAWVKDEARFKIGMWSRQTGKSFSTACEAVVDCLLRPGQHWVCLSSGERQAFEWMRKAHLWTKALQVAVSSYDETVNAADATLSKAEIAFKNGSRITAIPANPDTARGYSANLILDEFASHEKPWEIWAAIYPTITSPHGGLKKLRIVSTPRGLGNKFADIWIRSDAFSKHKNTIYDAARQGLDVDIEALRAGVDDEDVWAQEYLCEFLDASGVLLPYELLSACTAEHLQDPGEGPIVLGMDIGRSHDLSVICALAEFGGALVLFAVEELRECPFAEQLRRLGRWLENPRVIHASVDATGIGAMLAEEARRRYGSRVEEFQFTRRSKEAIYSGMRRAFEDKRIRIPGNRELREDLHAIEKNVSAGGTITYSAARSADGHSDRASALALALHAATTRGIWLPPQIIRRRARHEYRRLNRQ